MSVSQINYLHIRPAAFANVNLPRVCSLILLSSKKSSDWQNPFPWPRTGRLWLKIAKQVLYNKEYNQGTYKMLRQECLTLVIDLITQRHLRNRFIFNYFFILFLFAIRKRCKELNLFSKNSNEMEREPNKNHTRYEEPVISREWKLKIFWTNIMNYMYYCKTKDFR